MIINLVYDSSVTSSPYAAAIMRAAQEAANLLDATFSNPVTINISVGWGEEDGDAITNPAVAAQSHSNGDVFGYDDVKNALIGAAHTVIDQIATSTLPTSDPTGGTTIGGNIYISQAEQKALGLRDANDPGLDGSVGLNSLLTFFLDGQPGAISDPAGTTQFDAVGVLMHEMTEVMGRVAGLGQKTYASSVNTHQYTALDFFRHFGRRTAISHPGRGDRSLSITFTCCRHTMTPQPRPTLTEATGHQASLAIHSGMQCRRRSAHYRPLTSRK